MVNIITTIPLLFGLEFFNKTCQKENKHILIWIRQHFISNKKMFVCFALCHVRGNLEGPEYIFTSVACKLEKIIITWTDSLSFIDAAFSGNDLASHGSARSDFFSCLGLRC